MRSVISPARNPRRAWRDRRRDRTIRSGCGRASPAPSSSATWSRATPIALFASSTSPIAAMRGSALDDARAVDQPGLAGIAGAGVDLVEPDQGGPQRPLPRSAAAGTASRIAIAWNMTRLRISSCERWPVMSLPCAMPITPLTSTNRVAPRGEDEQDDEDDAHAGPLRLRERISSRQFGPRAGRRPARAGSAPAARRSARVGAPCRLASRPPSASASRAW